MGIDVVTFRYLLHSATTPCRK